MKVSVLLYCEHLKIICFKLFFFLIYIAVDCRHMKGFNIFTRFLIVILDIAIHIRQTIVDICFITFCTSEERGFNRRENG
jgi:hypothetical protein